ncbi:MAG: hypothetical protein ACLR6J_13000 [Parabacteroides merdae]
MEVICVALKGHLRHGDGNSGHASDYSGRYPGDECRHGEPSIASSTIAVKSSRISSRSGRSRVRRIQTPHYKSYDIRPVLKKNELGVMIAPDGSAPASINQDAWFSMGTLDAGLV